MLGNAARGFGIGVGIFRLDAIAEVPPTLAGVGTGDAGAQRCAGQRGEQGLVAGEGVAVGARLEQSRDPARRTPQHPGDLVAARRGQGKEARRPLGPGVDPVEDERVEVQVRIQGGAEALDESDGAALARPALGDSIWGEAAVMGALGRVVQAEGREVRRRDA